MRHIYEYEGNKVPSVTTILGLLAKPVLIGWANKLGLEGVSYWDELKRTANIGTLVHNACEFYLLNPGSEFAFETEGKMMLSDSDVEEYQACVDKFKAIYNEHEFTNVQSERSFVSNLYGGTVDIICDMDGVKTLLDIKTSKEVYAENKIQLVAYSALIEDYDKISEEKIGIKQLAILSLPARSDNPGKIEFVSEYEIPICADIFADLLNLNTHLKYLKEEK